MKDHHVEVATATSCHLLGTQNESESRRKRNARKLGRRRIKCVNVVQKDIGIDVVDEPRVWLIIWGLGLGSGTTKKRIREEFDNPEEIRYLKDKCYCFVRYRDVNEATRVKELHEEKFFEMSLREDGAVKRFIGFVGDPPEESREVIASFSTSNPPGLQIIHDFISAEEENAALSAACVYGNNGGHEVVSKNLKHRWVRHFGFEFRYGLNDIDFKNPLSEGIPNCLEPIVNRLLEKGVFKEVPEQLTINQYQCGQGIPPHVDTHSCFESPIVSLSTGSKVVMNFCRGEFTHSVIVPPRSLLIMNGECRYGWTHGISNRSFDIIPSEDGSEIDVLNRCERTSFTFRKLNFSQKCRCTFPEMCNSQQGKISDENAAKLEQTMVHKIYERIASHFHETRHTPWPRVKEFLKNIKEGSLVLDIGCGNGKYFNINRNLIQFGSDMSNGLLDICRNKNAEVVRANALKLPFNDESFEAAICIAVLHHISTKERRMAALEEIFRILTPGGEALIYVWAKNQHHQEESVYATNQSAKATSSTKTTVEICDPLTRDFSFLPVYEREADFPQNDVLVPWVNIKDPENPVHHRYYHVFDEGELETLISELEYIAQVSESYYDQGNWVVRVRKQS